MSIFEEEYNRLENITICSFRFDVLTDDEKNEALLISKYILSIKLQKGFDQIENDLNTFLPFMFKFNRGIFSATYSISLLNINIDITNTGIEDVKIPKFKIRELEANSKFKKYSDKYLAYELVSINKEVNKAVSKSFLNSRDLELFFSHYEELSNGESEVNMKSSFEGEGGFLQLKAQMKPLKLLKASIILSSIKLIVTLIIIIGLISLAIYNNLILWLFIGGFILFIFISTFITEEIDQLKLLAKEYKIYGK